ncbi:NAD(P)/FAD-dependent oxidoreductase [Streptoalloteichus hindustanus]|uniref:Dehydrogenase (Flavoprotein) n=1 Tax=Streptoalloteichus hindustanus TaxID=2017 RepID=A0A1M5P590_STRHI|nr:FAD-dependent monooxygenase [Streptoalloteichus hindustanus]SHG97001.1 Dehydrogenase (flavoprotein) [Streptoalloteichus hindustanus]
MGEDYDVVVVGARCAGAPTAMLLARRGHRVLLVDRATFPSDTLSTHYLHLPAVARLRDWGLLDRVLATGCPRITGITLGVGDLYLSGMSPEWEGVRFGVAPRRFLLDHLLVEAAAAAGAEVRQEWTVDRVLTAEDGRVVGVQGRDRAGRTEVVTATMVVGADGARSLVARTVAAEEQLSAPARTAVWYAYWQGTDIREILVRIESPEIFIVPTNDDCVNVLVGCRSEEFAEFRADIEGSYLRVLDRFPDIGRRVRSGRRVGPLRGTRDTRQWLRRTHGPGWALVGDALQRKDPVAGIGISDAFRQADALAHALDAGLTGRRPMAQALAGFGTWCARTFRDHFDHVAEMAKLAACDPDQLRLFEALRHNEEQRTRFFGTVGAQVSPQEFFAPENIARIISGAPAHAARHESCRRKASTPA